MKECYVYILTNWNDRVMYIEQTTDVHAALEREKQLKRWSRIKKNQLVESTNPEWKDLSAEWD